MPVTDLTGTTWVFNDTIDITKRLSYSLMFYTSISNENFTSFSIDTRSKNMTYVSPNADILHVYDSSGWLNETYKTITITGGADATNTNLINWLEANAAQQAVSRKSVDLTTLPGWSSLSSGTHNITIVAKAAGYKDSEPSAAVSVENGAPVYTDCITFTGESSDFTLAVGSDGAKEWNGVVEYSTDHNTWTVWDGTAVSSVDKKLYLRGSGNTKFHTSKGAKLHLSAKAACSGNIQTLLEYSNPPTSIPASACYNAMFEGCTSLTQAPDLPATTLKSSCYGHMFRSCTSLTTAPVLPATTLVDYCYNCMFLGCTSLTQAPALPATTLATSCYQFMFNGCKSLKISATQSSEYPTAWRIPSSGTISSTATSWNINMLSSTGGTFTSNPSINTTYYGAWGGVTNLISFTIAGTSYQAEEGMTWEQWVNSSYNTGGYYTMEASITVWFSNGVDQVSAESFSGGQADKTSQIVANGIYYKFNGGSIGN